MKKNQPMELKNYDPDRDTNTLESDLEYAFNSDSEKRAFYRSLTKNACEYNIERYNERVESEVSNDLNNLDNNDLIRFIGLAPRIRSALLRELSDIAQDEKMTYKGLHCAIMDAVNIYQDKCRSELANRDVLVTDDDVKKYTPKERLLSRVREYLR